MWQLQVCTVKHFVLARSKGNGNIALFLNTLSFNCRLTSGKLIRIEYLELDQSSMLVNGLE